MRTWAWLAMLASGAASADPASADPASIDVRRLTELPPEGLLRLDARELAIDLSPRASTAQLSYDLGWFRVGVGAAIDDGIAGSHRMIGLFAYRTFDLSRWMHAWISLGLTFDEWTFPGTALREHDVTVGLSLGTTFR